MNIKTRTAAFLSAFILLLLSASGVYAASGNDMEQMSHMDGMEHGAKTETFSFGAPGNPLQVSRTITVAMKDISFEPSSIQIKQGETIRFVVNNHSEVDHDFTIGDTRTQTAHRKEMAEMAQMGGAMHHADDPNAVFVKAGQTGELVWTFTRPGKLEFDCNVPGHFEAGMGGKIMISAKN
ncbi:MAG TPA: cupredoxin family protein [Candidatus Sulfotelmatobacter sp.]|jgi:uncharacterized cupredoxin-like copper-binding protein|nr:cupredoxin family protein [Candidatus Sulfotelmatobacter sp.]